MAPASNSNTKKKYKLRRRRSNKSRKDLIGIGGGAMKLNEERQSATTTIAVIAAGPSSISTLKPLIAAKHFVEGKRGRGKLRVGMLPGRAMPPQNTSGLPPPSPVQPGIPAGGAVLPQQQGQPQQQSAQFPNCASDVLARVGDFVKQCGQNHNKGWNRAKAKELQNLIDNELFCLAPDRRSTRLNPLQNLRLLGMVCTYFTKEVSKEMDPQLRYLHFDIIFCGREGEVLLHDARVQFLVKICSLAAQYPVYGLYAHVAQWLSKVSRDDLKRTYAEQIVAELVEGFVMAPEHCQLFEYLLPLVNHSFDFCANFIVFSISAESCGPVLATIIGEWLAERSDQFLRALSQFSHLSNPFCASKFDLLIKYDCSNSRDDEVHHRFHAALLQIVSGWRHGFEPQQPQTRLPPSNIAAVNQQIVPLSKPIINSLPELFPSIDSLPLISQTRLLENSICCFRAAFLSTSEPFRARIASAGAKELATGFGGLWQSLATVLAG